MPWVETFAAEEGKTLRLPSFVPNLLFFKRYDCGLPHYGITDYDGSCKLGEFIKNMKL